MPSSSDKRSTGGFAGLLPLSGAPWAAERHTPNCGHGCVPDPPENRFRGRPSLRRRQGFLAAPLRMRLGKHDSPGVSRTIRSCPECRTFALQRAQELAFKGFSEPRPAAVPGCLPRPSSALASAFALPAAKRPCGSRRQCRRRLLLRWQR